MIVVYTTAVPPATKFGTVWPHIVASKMLGAVVELMLQAQERRHGFALELPTWEGEK